MDINLSGKTALITGSTRGIGRKTAETLAKMGATVHISGRDAEKVEQAVQEITTSIPGSRIVGLTADVSTPDGVEKCKHSLPEFDILVNNIATFYPKSFCEVTDEEWQTFFRVNVMSGVRLSRLYMPGMLKRNWGRIIFVSSESGVLMFPELIHYGMTKSAQLSVARGLAELTEGTNVTVNSVLPGLTGTAVVQDAFKQMGESEGSSFDEKKFLKDTRPTSLIDRLLTEQEVANMIAYLASSGSSGINGSAMRVEGGLLRQI